VFLLSFAVNGEFSPLYIHSRLSEQCQFKIACAFGTYFFSEQASRRGLLERFSELERNFKEGSRNLIFNFLHKMAAIHAQYEYVLYVLLPFISLVINGHKIAISLLDKQI